MTTLEKILKLISENGLTATEFAVKAGLPKNAVSEWKSGRIKPSADAIIKTAKFFNVSTDYLLRENDEECRGFCEPELIDLSDFVRLPVLGFICAGDGIGAHEEVLGYESISLSSLPSKNAKDYFCLNVRGDSMVPEIKSGDVVIVRRCQNVDSGSIAAVLIDEEDACVKKLNRSKDTVELISFNPYYPPRLFKQAEANRVRVMGRVIQAIRKF